MNQRFRTLLVAACTAAFCVTGLAQTPPVTMLEVDVENSVLYVDDLDSRSKLAQVPTMVPIPAEVQYRVFKRNVQMADIVAVNGRPVKGFFVCTFAGVLASVALTPGRAIADLAGSCPAQTHYVFLHADGTPIGTISVAGVLSGVPSASAPAVSGANMYAILGGTGPFLGARGQAGILRSVVGARLASMAEDPAYRRIHGGGKTTYYIHLLPASWPEVMSTAGGPAVYHAVDFSLVTGEKPARAGETLAVSAANLGPTLPRIDPGKPFPAWQAGKEHAVNSPVEVTVNGKAAEVRNAVGWPGMNNVYRVDFRVPEGTGAGTATLGLSVAWINGPEVKIPVR